MQSSKRDMAATIIADERISQRGKLLRTFHEVDG
jgi:hypothetical protein